MISGVVSQGRAVSIDLCVNLWKSKENKLFSIGFPMISGGLTATVGPHIYMARLLFLLSLLMCFWCVADVFAHDRAHCIVEMPSEVSFARCMP